MVLDKLISYEASEKLKGSLIEAVKSLHPELIFKVPEEKSHACNEFLKEYLNNNGFVFSTNYDLLPYWVLMRNNAEKKSDGFGRYPLTDFGDEYVDPDQIDYSELIWGKHKEVQNVFYLHGALPFFDNGINIIKEEYTSEHYLLQNIRERIDKKEYPIFVTAGNGNEKLTHIMHNKYLTFCYEKLCAIKGSLVTFGFNFGEYDEHIIDAINVAAKQHISDRLRSVYIGVFSEEGLEHVLDIQKKFKCKVIPYNAKTANIWGHT